MRLGFGKARGARHSSSTGSSVRRAAAAAAIRRSTAAATAVTAAATARTVWSGGTGRGGDELWDGLPEVADVAAALARPRDMRGAVFGLGRAFGHVGRVGAGAAVARRTRLPSVTRRIRGVLLEPHGLALRASEHLDDAGPNLDLLDHARRDHIGRAPVRAASGIAIHNQFAKNGTALPTSEGVGGWAGIEVGWVAMVTHPAPPSQVLTAAPSGTGCETTGTLS